MPHALGAQVRGDLVDLVVLIGVEETPVQVALPPVAESLMAMNEPREEAEPFVPRTRKAK